MTVLIVVVMVSAVVVILILRARPEQRATPSEPSVSPETADSSWSSTAIPVALGAAALDDHHLSQSHSDGDADGRTGESGWGEHGAGGSWSESGESAEAGDSGGSDGGDSGGDSGGSD